MGIETIAAIATAAAAVGGTAYTIATKQNPAKQAAANTAKDPNVKSDTTPGQDDAVSGAASTLLTGTNGVNPSSLNLGKASGLGTSTLLGGGNG